MTAGAEVLVGLVVLIGLIGIVVPVLPGVVLIFAAIGVWAFVVGTASAWTVFGIATALLVASGVVKYLWPGRRLKTAGVPTRSIVAGGVVGIVGFFVVPVVGLFLGFPLGVYLAELPRARTSGSAWQSTVHATKAVGLSILVELFGGLLAAGVWVVAVIVL
ncbi:MULTISPECIES: DUF456 domain-containing protein [unclassified Rhodococcus (in: high G+C Gram-positive bacteria)]|uniref:DUF456 domain-containing protein n=1 Tax=unclassified Rhodococcus (in: high G+C Gram-positive bacteria) TaxID=192944 RepID=UPI00048533D2|nr:MULTISPECIES: DUF456 domain-containing protein [unclassified Rhodococcus (in: high G+C Gram-positive bacteria)]KQU36120.1 hypothetical protein ASG69_17530 [Rhodococcus sp. Leaf225]KQU48668.1 hypothetical protein ASH03_02005 [Rhodococcus sp. Leaf258]MBY6677105.1 DUF456 domain-containing protein [Rhodococcus sp. BP-332]MBY6707173.1 DUF456 domain-containing protein [Rhodococcus sp. BP-241]MDQ1199915.1 uncharacterized protein YqgC (DUF456 family) [Rhodococcus sp. SORGH_AS_0303]